MRNQGKIIVADAEVHILHLVSVKLRGAGHDVVTARDGKELFELAQIERPDLIVSEVQLPGLSGVEVCQRLRQIPGGANIPAIMLTNSGFTLGGQTLEKAGVQACISKPFGTSELLRAVENALASVAA